MFSLIKVEKYLPENIDEYFAHIENDRKEPLVEHLKLTYEYFKKLVEVHKLEKIINNMCGQLSDFYMEEGKKGSEFIKELFYNVPIFHDVGKLNPNFQIEKMNNYHFEKKINLDSKHSKIGALIYINEFMEISNEKFSSEENGVIIRTLLIKAFGDIILNHHNPFLKYSDEDTFSKKFIKNVNCMLTKKKIDASEIFNLERYLKYKNLVYDKGKYFLLFALLKLNYSLLTTADYYSSSHFMNNWDSLVNDFGVLNHSYKKEFQKRIVNSTSYNIELYKNIKNYQLAFPKDKNNKNLNILRQNLAYEVVTNIRKNIHKNLFYIEAPTGSGKTNLSILAIKELLNNDITKILYVFPFTTLITQTYEYIRNTLGLSNSDIVQIHSKASFTNKNDNSNSDIDIINYQFINYPVSLISHVRFFKIIKSSSKSINYLFHRIANSIVIIDELQAYPPKEWDKIIYYIRNYSEYFNIKFILMSATLPKIDKLETKDSDSNNIFVNLVNNKERYFKNKNFRERIKFDFSMIKNEVQTNKKDKACFFKKLWKKIKSESLTYKVKNKNVKTIIEFIFKTTATEFFSYIKEYYNEIFDEVFIIDGSILEPRKKEIIFKLKSKKYEQKSILLVSTQVIEAGMDIDMDIGFKDVSIIDSEEQLAGRINRNMRKNNCKLFLFNLDPASKIYGSDYRYKNTKGYESEEYKEILENKNFDKIYNKIVEYIERLNKSSFVNLSDYKKSIKNLDFSEIDNKFKLIEDQIEDITIFVPIEIPIMSKIDNENTVALFTKQQLKYLKENGLNYEKFKNRLPGEKIWELFEEKIKCRSRSFSQFKKDMIILNSIMSNFSFSIGSRSKLIEKLKISGNIEERYGYFYLHNASTVYSYENGFQELEETINIW